MEAITDSFFYSLNEKLHRIYDEKTKARRWKWKKKIAFVWFGNCSMHWFMFWRNNFKWQTTFIWFSTKFDMHHQSFLINSLCTTFAQILSMSSSKTVSKLNFATMLAVLSRESLSRARKKKTYTPQSVNWLWFVLKLHLAVNLPAGKYIYCECVCILAQCQASSSLFNCLIRFSNNEAVKKVLCESSLDSMLNARELYRCVTMWFKHKITFCHAKSWTGRSRNEINRSKLDCTF